MKPAGIHAELDRNMDLYLCMASSAVFHDLYSKWMVWLPNYKTAGYADLMHSLRSMFPAFQHRFVPKVLTKAGFEGIYGILFMDEKWPDPKAENIALFQGYRQRGVFDRDVFKYSVSQLKVLADKYPDKKFAVVMVSPPEKHRQFIINWMKKLPDNVYVWGMRPPMSCSRRKFWRVKWN